MKKLFILLLLVTATTIFAQYEYEYKSSSIIATHISLKINSNQFSDWKKLPTPIKVYYNPKINRMIIFTEDVQVIDYDDMNVIIYDTHYYYYTTATDSYYTKFNLHLEIYNSGLAIVRLVYLNIEYRYILVKT